MHSVDIVRPCERQSLTISGAEIEVQMYLILLVPSDSNPSPCGQRKGNTRQFQSARDTQT